MQITLNGVVQIVNQGTPFYLMNTVKQDSFMVLVPKLFKKIMTVVIYLDRHTRSQRVLFY